MAGRNKTDDNISRLILKERSNNKFWGCRKLAQLLKEKYSIKISKSTVNKIVKDHGIYSKKGRKKDLSIYKKRHKDLAGLYIFKSFVDEIGLFDEIVTQLKDIFPKIRKERLKKILLYISFCKYLAYDSIKSELILKFLKIKTISFKVVTRLEETLSRYSPVINLTTFNKRIDMVYSLKFVFGNGKYLFSDAKLLNLKSQPNLLRYYALPLFKVELTLEKVKSINSIIIFARPSVEYLSGLIFDFFNNLKSGIKKIELLGKKGETIKEISCNNFKPSFLIGYVPYLVYKSIYFREKPKHKKVLFDPFCYFYLTNCYSEFLQNSGKQAFKANNVLIRRKKESFPCWGIITNSEFSYGLVKEYFYFWPYLEEVFLNQHVNNESDDDNFDNVSDSCDFLPDTMVMDSFSKTAKLLDNLSKIIKLRGVDWKKNILCAQGSISKGKKWVKIFIPKMDPALKKQINCSSVFVENKRLFVF